MTKAELVSKISEKTGVEKITALSVVESMMNEIKDSIESNESVFLRGFGTFKAKKKELKKQEGILKEILLLLFQSITYLRSSLLKNLQEE